MEELYKCRIETLKSELQQAVNDRHQMALEYDDLMTITIKDTESLHTEQLILILRNYECVKIEMFRIFINLWRKIYLIHGWFTWVIEISKARELAVLESENLISLRCEELEKNLDILNQKLENHDQLLIQHENNYNSDKVSLEKIIRERDSKLTSLLFQITELESSHEADNITIETLKEKLRAALQSIDVLQLNNIALEKDLDESVQHIIAIEEDARKWKAYVTGLEEGIRLRDEQLKYSEEIIEELQTNVALDSELRKMFNQIKVDSDSENSATLVVHHEVTETYTTIQRLVVEMDNICENSKYMANERDNAITRLQHISNEWDYMTMQLKVDIERWETAMTATEYSASEAEQGIINVVKEIEKSEYEIVVAMRQRDISKAQYQQILAEWDVAQKELQLQFATWGDAVKTFNLRDQDILSGIADIMDEVDKLSFRNTKLGVSLKVSEDFITEQVDRISSQEANINQLNIRNIELELSSQTWEDAVREAQHLIADQNERINYQEVENEKIIDELENAVRSLRECENNLQLKSYSYDELRQKHDNLLNLHDQESRKCLSIEKQLNVLKDENYLLKIEIARNSEKILEFQQSFCDATVISSALNDITEEVDHMREEFDAEVCEDLPRIINQIDSEMKNINSEIINIVNECENLYCCSKSFELQVLNLKESLNVAEHNIFELKNSLLEQKNSRLAIVRDFSIKSIEQENLLQNAYEEMENLRSNKKFENAIRSDSVLNYEQRIFDLVSKLDSIEKSRCSEITLYTNSIAKLEVSKVISNNKIEDLESQLTDANAFIQTLCTVNNETQSVILDLDQTINSLLSDVTLLRDKFNSGFDYDASRSISLEQQVSLWESVADRERNAKIMLEQELRSLRSQLSFYAFSPPVFQCNNFNAGSILLILLRLWQSLKFSQGFHAFHTELLKKKIYVLEKLNRHSQTTINALTTVVDSLQEDIDLVEEQSEHIPVDIDIKGWTTMSLTHRINYLLEERSNNNVQKNLDFERIKNLERELSVIKNSTMIENNKIEKNIDTVEHQNQLLMIALKHLNVCCGLRLLCRSFNRIQRTYLHRALYYMYQPLVCKNLRMQLEQARIAETSALSTLVSSKAILIQKDSEVAFTIQVYKNHLDETISRIENLEFEKREIEQRRNLMESELAHVISEKDIIVSTCDYRLSEMQKVWRRKIILFCIHNWRIVSLTRAFFFINCCKSKNTSKFDTASSAAVVFLSRRSTAIKILEKIGYGILIALKASTFSWWRAVIHNKQLVADASHNPTIPIASYINTEIERISRNIERIDVNSKRSVNIISHFDDLFTSLQRDKTSISMDVGTLVLARKEMEKDVSIMNSKLLKMVKSMDTVFLNVGGVTVPVSAAQVAIDACVKDTTECEARILTLEYELLDVNARVKESSKRLRTVTRFAHLDQMLLIEELTNCQLVLTELLG